MNLRKRIANWILKPEVDRLRALTEVAVNDFRMLPYLQARDPQALIEQLAEVDSRLVDYLVRQIRDAGLGMDTGETFRIQIVKECRALYLADPLTQFAVELWTDYAFGEAPNLTAEDPDAQSVWNEFWSADRNAPVLGERRLHKRSEDQLTDGELFWVVFASTLDGAATVRTIPTEQIKEIVRDPEDSSVVLYYKREFVGSDHALDVLYYPDWHASPEQLARANLPTDAKLANTLKGETDVVVMHAAFREVNGRGWPLATASVDWSREYKQFLQNRAAVARAAATFVEKIKVKGGQRAIDMIKSRLGTSLSGSNDSFENNPPPVPGSTWLENEALDRQWMNRPTNSADAEKDGMALLTQAGLGYKLYPHYLGRGDTYRLATSTAMEGPTLKSFNRYQAFWSSVWKDMFKIVVGFAEKYGTQSFTSHEAVVSSDRIITLSTEDVTAAVNTLTGLVDRGLIDTQAASAVAMSLMKTSLETMGVQGVSEMLTVETREAGESQFPFSESKSGPDQYRQNLRGPLYGLWSGKIGRDDFIDQYQIAIDAGLRNAWIEGMQAAGLTEEDMTQEEETALASFVLEQYEYVAGLADYIELNSKANKGKLEALMPRLGQWVNRYNQARSRALLLAKSDPLLTWHEGPTHEKCDDCIYSDGRTYRASVWKRWGWETQSPDLACGGFECQCELKPALPGVKANKGHPRRPSGKG